MLCLTGHALKILKGIHIFSVCSWLGGGLALLVLTGAKHQGLIPGEAVYGADLAAHLVDRWAVVNLGAFVCLGTGLAYGLLTGWGFFRQGWITVKWGLLVCCILFGMWLGGQERIMLDLSRHLGGAALSSPDYLAVQARYGLGAAVQVGVVIFIIFLSVFRPWKRAPSGRNR